MWGGGGSECEGVGIEEHQQGLWSDLRGERGLTDDSLPSFIHVEGEGGRRRGGVKSKD